MTTLFSPLGLSYGALYSTILLTRPARVVVVTSPEAIFSLGATLDAARFFHTQFEWEGYVLEDAASGFGEGRALAPFLAAAAGSENIVNISGGTTESQECVKSVAEILRRDGKNVREVVAIDRRDLLEQRRAPLTLGELVEVPPL